MTSPLTLGQGIMAAAVDREAAGDYHGWGSDTCSAAWRCFRALCDRAAAAERLARAGDALERAYLLYCEDSSDSCATGHQAAYAAFRAALDPWREVTNG